MTAVRADLRTMTTGQVAELTGIKPVTLRQWRRRGMRPHSFRAHGVVLYRVAEVEAWLTESEAAESGPHTTVVRPGAERVRGERDGQRSHTSSTTRPATADTRSTGPTPSRVPRSSSTTPNT